MVISPPPRLAAGYEIGLAKFCSGKWRRFKLTKQVSACVVPNTLGKSEARWREVHASLWSRLHNTETVGLYHPALAVSYSFDAFVFNALLEHRRRHQCRRWSKERESRNELRAPSNIECQCRDHQLVAAGEDDPMVQYENDRSLLAFCGQGWTKDKSGNWRIIV